MIEKNKMTIDQALKIIEVATSQLRLTRQEHQALIEAINAIKNEIKPGGK
jgi:hypothetical protein